MTDLSNAARSQALNSLDGGTQNLLAWVALHTGDPSTTGLNEATTTSGRQTTTWTASSGGTAKTNVAALTFTLTAVAVSWLGMWSAATTGTFGIGAQLSSSVTAATVTVAAGAISLAAS